MTNESDQFTDSPQTPPVEGGVWSTATPEERLEALRDAQEDKEELYGRPNVPNTQVDEGAVAASGLTVGNRDAGQKKKTPKRSNHTARRVRRYHPSGLSRVIPKDDIEIGKKRLAEARKKLQSSTDSSENDPNSSAPRNEAEMLYPDMSIFEIARHLADSTQVVYRVVKDESGEWEIKKGDE